uniref:Uncharacterized protein n=1 Tax=Cacopsylla melanoneura TaxID=428564 RepID=A0A8D8ZAD9_9HEMI
MNVVAHYLFLTHAPCCEPVLAFNRIFLTHECCCSLSLSHSWLHVFVHHLLFLFRSETYLNTPKREVLWQLIFLLCGAMCLYTLSQEDGLSISIVRGNVASVLSTLSQEDGLC